MELLIGLIRIVIKRSGHPILYWYTLPYHIAATSNSGVSLTRCSPSHSVRKRTSSLALKALNAWKQNESRVFINTKWTRIWRSFYPNRQNRNSEFLPVLFLSSAAISSWSHWKAEKMAFSSSSATIHFRSEWKCIQSFVNDIWGRVQTTWTNEGGCSDDHNT